MEYQNKQLINGETVTPLGTFSEAVAERKRQFNIIIMILTITSVIATPLSLICFFSIANENGIIEFIELIPLFLMFAFGILTAYFYSLFPEEVS